MTTSSIISALEAARDSLTPETWHKGSYFNSKNNSLCMCSHGALQAQVNPACHEVINRGGSEYRARGMATTGFKISEGLIGYPVTAAGDAFNVSQKLQKLQNNVFAAINEMSVATVAAQGKLDANKALTKVLDGTRRSGDGIHNDPSGIAADACIDVDKTLTNITNTISVSAPTFSVLEVAAQGKNDVSEELNEVADIATSIASSDGSSARISAAHALQDVAQAATLVVNTPKTHNGISTGAIAVASYADQKTVSEIVAAAKETAQCGGVVADEANELASVANEASATVVRAATTTVEGALFVDVANTVVVASGKDVNLDTLRSIWNKRSNWVKDDYQHNGVVYGNKDAHYLLGMVGLTASFNDATDTTLEMIHQKFDEAIELARQLGL
jgi:hypothetical protein